MIILGDISGIQSYLFDVAEAGGGQAQRLRARSFVIQLVAEAAAITVLRALGWSLEDAKDLILKRRYVVDFADCYVESVERFIEIYERTQPEGSDEERKQIAMRQKSLRLP